MTAPMQGPSFSAHILSLFPEMFPGSLGLSLAGRALAQGRWALAVHNIRDFATDKHASVDAPPLGGGSGMVMRPDVAARAIEAVAGPDSPQASYTKIYPSPRGRPLNQTLVRQWSTGPGLVILCGRYEGLDQRAIDACNLTEVSIGDYVLSGGEQAALVILDAVVRLLPGVMGKQDSHQQESFETGLLEHDHYTQPRLWQGRAAPDVLASGHHQNIAQWRQRNAEQITRDRRPDMWARYQHAKHEENNDKD